MPFTLRVKMPQEPKSDMFLFFVFCFFSQWNSRIVFVVVVPVIPLLLLLNLIFKSSAFCYGSQIQLLFG